MRKGKRLTLLGTEVACYHSERDRDAARRMCRACGATDEKLSLGEEKGWEITDKDWVVQAPIMPPSGLYIGTAVISKDTPIQELPIFKDFDMRVKGVLDDSNRQSASYRAICLVGRASRR